MPPRPSPSSHPRYHLLKTLEHSQREAVASSAMTSTCDNFMNAFALHLGASSIQLGFLTGIPQLLGSLMQLVSAGLGTFMSRRALVIATAVVQTLLMFAFAGLAMLRSENLATSLLLLVIFYHCTFNLIQPQWRAWMGSLVPQKQRGVFFASRSRLTMGTSLAVFLAGGLFLTWSDNQDLAWMGFSFLFVAAALGRAFSCYFLWQMQDPQAQTAVPNLKQFIRTFTHVHQAFYDDTFRHYSFFVAGMQGMVAISGPFFAVYMLNELHYSYFEFSLNLVASIATQFFMLRYWGKLSDKRGNRYVMLLCSAAMPIVPVLWLVSPNFFYLLLVQMLSGFAWSGFNLTTANYLYDIRPHHTNFATYAAIQATLTAALVFVGGAIGGVLATAAPAITEWLPLELGSGLFIVFTVSGLLRLVVFMWFVPRAKEPRLRSHPRLLKLIYRVARYNAISGVVLDWLTVTNKEKP